MYIGEPQASLVQELRSTAWIFVLSRETSCDRPTKLHCTLSKAMVLVPKDHKLFVSFLHHQFKDFHKLFANCKNQHLYKRNSKSQAYNSIHINECKVHHKTEVFLFLTTRCCSLKPIIFLHRDWKSDVKK